ncbi:Proteasome inhibitor PI31 subunit [Geodia barretti]|uniref:Proteasome inhibitor PI31 subunit n=1 Tax=Geodia barretti TaxID=519541 RepID=A0AA35REC2_GEOBA|nr:Proteasome inhibitor PI31 subunit [Geodia barretti]
MDESLDSVLEKCLEVCEARSPHDAVAVALHACLLADGFVCIATGDENFGEGLATRSPTSSKGAQTSPYGLPAGWNTSQDVYALQYHHPGQRKLILVKMIVIDTQLLISAMSAGDIETIHSLTLETDRYVRSQQFNTVSVYSNLLQLVSTLNKEIVSKLQQPAAKPSPSTTSASGTTSTSAAASSSRMRGDYDPLRVGPPRHPGVSPANPFGMPTPFGYGDADRFPFGYVPGARWDPVTPFGGGLPARGGGRPGRHHGEPDPDHLPPPGSDDMFS